MDFLPIRTPEKKSNPDPDNRTRIQNTALNVVSAGTYVQHRDCRDALVIKTSNQTGARNFLLLENANVQLFTMENKI